jgi:uncharacterized protein (DUF697 family)
VAARHADTHIVGMFERLWNAISNALFGDVQDTDAREQEARIRTQATAPVAWLLGKTGAGKTAIVAALTGDPRAEVGAGFEPCTRTAAYYDVPAEVPLLRFLDTRGLGEAEYDPETDIAWCEGQAHLLMAVMQVDDPAQESVIRVVREARCRHADWPLLVAQTGLHRLYAGGAGHPEPYPYTGGAEDVTNPEIAHALRQSLAHQRKLFDGMHGPLPRFVPLDFTLAEDGFPPQDFGLEMFWRVLEATGPLAFEALHRARADADSDRIRARARPLIYGYGGAAAGAGAIPVPVVGVGGLAGALALMLRVLAQRYGVEWTPGAFGRFTGAIGGGALLWWGLRYGLREAFKFVPVIGAAVAGGFNAAAAFAVTVGMGEAACVWLGYQRRGQTAPDDTVRRAFAEGIAIGLRQAKNKAALPASRT